MLWPTWICYVTAFTGGPLTYPKLATYFLTMLMDFLASAFLNFCRTSIWWFGFVATLLLCLYLCLDLWLKAFPSFVSQLLVCWSGFSVATSFAAAAFLLHFSYFFLAISRLFPYVFEFLSFLFSFVLQLSFILWNSSLRLGFYRFN